MRALSVTQEHSRGVQDGAVHALLWMMPWTGMSQRALNWSIVVCPRRDAFVWREWTQLVLATRLGQRHWCLCQSLVAIDDPRWCGGSLVVAFLPEDCVECDGSEDNHGSDDFGGSED